MKKLTYIFLLIGFSVSAQFKLNYSDVQDLYGSRNLNSKFEGECLIETKKVTNFINATFMFLKKDSLLVSVIFKKPKGFDKTKFENFSKEFFTEFSPSKITDFENQKLYLDGKNSILGIKGFNNFLNDEIEFVTDKRVIDSFLILFNKSH